MPTPSPGPSRTSALEHPANPKYRQVILVNRDDQVVGVAEKAAAHRRPGHLHRAFSVFLVDDRGRLLLQRRAPTAHHFQRLWSNTCCSHPQPGESVDSAARRRLVEELGLDAASLTPMGRFHYQARDPGSGLVEQEIDHVLAGPGAADPRPDPAEVDDWCWATAQEVRTRMERRPDTFTPWIRPALDLALPDWRTAPTFTLAPPGGGEPAFGAAPGREGATGD